MRAGQGHSVKFQTGFDTHVPNPILPLSNFTRPEFTDQEKKLRHSQTMVDFLMGRRDSIGGQKSIPSFLPGPSC